MSDVQLMWRCVPIDFATAKHWCLTEHYARRVPSISYAYGLTVFGVLRGVCLFGTPASSPLRSGVCGPEHKGKVLELNRLAISDNEPNMASWLIAKALKRLPRPSIVVSYADTSQGHLGVVYQAANFIYTGLSAKRTDWKLRGREDLHGQTVADLSRNAFQEKRVDYMRRVYGDDFYLHPRPRKHRYIFFIGSRKEKKLLNSALRYKQQAYPRS